MGEPAGISSEITLKVWKKHRNTINPFVYIGDTNHLLKTNLLDTNEKIYISFVPKANTLH